MLFPATGAYLASHIIKGSYENLKYSGIVQMIRYNIDMALSNNSISPDTIIRSHIAKHIQTRSMCTEKGMHVIQLKNVTLSHKDSISQPFDSLSEDEREIHGLSLSYLKLARFLGMETKCEDYMNTRLDHLLQQDTSDIEKLYNLLSLKVLELEGIGEMPSVSIGKDDREIIDELLKNE